MIIDVEPPIQRLMERVAESLELLVELQRERVVLLRESVALQREGIDVRSADDAMLAKAIEESGPAKP